MGGIIGAPAIQESSPTLMMVLWKIFPNGHSLHLWHPDFGIRTGTMLGLIAIGVAWFALGYWRFSRRDA